jgi:hypothetical protein
VLKTHDPEAMMSRDGAIQMMLWHEGHKYSMSLARSQHAHSEEPFDAWTVHSVGRCL